VQLNPVLMLPDLPLAPRDPGPTVRDSYARCNVPMSATLFLALPVALNNASPSLQIRTFPSMMRVRQPVE